MMERTLTLGSLFSGSGGFELAGMLSGITPVFNAEVEPFAIRVTTKRLPDVKHYGDVSVLSGAELPPVDIITFGSPCQDMSIAGKRAGLDGARSGLFHQAVRIVKEMREKTNGDKPRYIVWENVPGAFSSNGGEDFRAVLQEIIGIKEPTAQVPAPDKNGWPNADVYLGDGWSVAYRLMDAQFWGVPQRRARIYLVADFGGERAGDILFKSEGLSGYSAESFCAWQRAATHPESGAGEAGSCLRWCINTQGNSGVYVTDDYTGALVAQDHGNHPAVVQAAGFCTEHSAQSRSIGYEEEKSPTLRSEKVPAALALQSNPTDSRLKIAEDGIVQTLTKRAGTGGNNVPLVAEPEAITLKIRCGRPGGGKGPLVTEGLSATLGTHNDQTLFVPTDQKDPAYAIGKEAFTGGEKAAFNFAVNEEVAPTMQTTGPSAVAHPEIRAFGVSSLSSKGMQSDNPKAGFYEAETSRTLDQRGGNPSCNQGGIAVVAPDPTFALQGSMIGRKDENGPQGDGVNEDVSFTLNTIDKHAVAAPVGEHYSTSKGSFHMDPLKEKVNTLIASDWKDPPTVTDEAGSEPVYIVRRLTPTECARLQGFPDWWCKGLGTENPTEEELDFWADVFETHRRVISGGSTPKTRKQIIKWLRDPYTPGAEYRLWGNGVSLPVAFFVMAGIAWADSLE